MSQYDNKDYHGIDLSDRTDMDGLTITGLCLSKETVQDRVLPPNLTGVTFINCNLDNVFIPDGNTLIECSNRFFQVQRDGQDWIVDHNTFAPIEPLNMSYAVDNGLPTTPDELAAWP